jgi:hypothetical protein
MQRYAGRTTDQWRRFAALDPRDSEQPPAWHDSTRGRGACRNQHRSDYDRGADAEHVGMRREHDDESGDARHDGAGQRHGRGGNARRIVAIGLLRRKLASARRANHKTPFIKPYLMVRPVSRAYVFGDGPTALAPGGGI